MDPTTAVTTALAVASGHLSQTIVESLAELWQEAEESVSEDQWQEPRPEFAGPLLESAKYYSDSGILRDMFRELLSAGMDRNKEHLAHPAFIHVLSQISSDEAYLLTEFGVDTEYRGNGLIIKTWRRDEIGEPWGECKTTIHLNDDTLDRITFPANLEMYVDHLEQLGILEEVVTFTDSDNLSIGGTYSADPIARLENPPVEIPQEATRKDGDVRLTDFGLRFVEAVIPDDL